MKITTLIFSLILLCGGQSLGQDFYSVTSVHLATFKMNDLRVFQQRYVASTQVSVKTVTDFPSYIGYSTELGVHVSEATSLGLLLSFNSTGSRADYQDYSGQIRMDQLLRGFSVGSMIKTKVNKSERWPVYLSLAVSLLKTSYKLSTSVTLGDVNQYEKLDLVSNNITALPSLVIRHAFSKRYFMQMHIGYEVNFAGRIYARGNRDAYLIDTQNNPIKIQWDGMRIGVGAGFRMGDLTPEPALMKHKDW